MITVFSDNKEIPINIVEFSDGALTFKLNELPDKPKYISVNVDPKTPIYRVREEVSLIVSCIENYYGGYLMELDFPVYLNIPYLPYARADRVFEKGNPSPLFDFLSWLNNQGFDEINICDVHNETTINHYFINNKSQLQCFKESLPFGFNTKYDYVIAPDKGAVDKAKNIAEHMEIDIVYASKKRDISTGKLTELVLPDVDFTNKIVLIPDDIGDGMGTHIWLADELKKAGANKVDLYLTHLIASKGLNVCKGKIDKLYYRHIVGNYINNEDVLKFNEEE